MGGRARELTFTRTIRLDEWRGYGVRPSRTHSFEDHLGRVRGTKSNIKDGYDTGTSLRHVVAVGDLAGAQPLRVQVVLEIRHFSRVGCATEHTVTSAVEQYFAAFKVAKVFRLAAHIGSRFTDAGAR